jgi:hypothetical protein
MYTDEGVTDLMVDGHKIWICKNPECRKTYAKYMKKENEDGENRKTV